MNIAYTYTLKKTNKKKTWKPPWCSIDPDSIDSNGDNTTGIEHEPRKLPTIAMERSHLQQQKVILNITIYILMKLETDQGWHLQNLPVFKNVNERCLSAVDISVDVMLYWLVFCDIAYLVFLKDKIHLTLLH